MAGSKVGKNTRRGFGSPGVASEAKTQALPAETAAASAVSTSVAEPAAVPAAAAEKAPSDYLDVEYVHEEGPPALLAGRWRAVEVWTVHRAYALDASLCCVEVLDRVSGRTTDHAIIGSTLVGGQVRGPGGAIEQVSHPFPRRGATAVFTRTMGNRLSYSETSPVTRVVLRLRVVDVSTSTQPPSWEEVTGPEGAGQE